MKYSFTMKIEGDTIIASYFNMTSEFQVLPSCDGCLVFMINSTAKNIKNLLHLMKLIDLELPEEISARSLYILGKGQTLTESDLEHFKKQASCLGFSGELDFLFNPEKSLCKEDEGIRLPFSE
ncbi:hypothetical protein CHARACLAT_024921 [Characodon lateralis]|uniref:Uncharacterized protein n=1 Tax=Characodon lateralis TaxID=208331 RepID=A0ABU7F5U1_9TELE|nr:hypothetical protein [Characodon lateralis]